MTRASVIFFAALGGWAIVALAWALLTWDLGRVLLTLWLAAALIVTGFYLAAPRGEP